MLWYWTLDSFSRPPQAGARLDHFVLKSHHQVKTPESLSWSTRPPMCDEHTAAHSTTLQPCPNIPSAVSALTPEGLPSFWAPSPIYALLSQTCQSGNLKCKFQLLHFTPAKVLFSQDKIQHEKSSPQSSLYPVVFHPSESTTIPRTPSFQSHFCHEDL